MNRILVGITLFLAAASSSIAEPVYPEANYYRVWRGFELPETEGTDAFIRGLPKLMRATTTLYDQAHRALNQYLVVVPPEDRPDYIPDEFALIALDSEENYREIRETEAGKGYGNLHWEFFHKDSSKSVELIDYFTQRSALESDRAYDLFGAPADWSTGVNTFFLGTRLESIPPDLFLERLQRHIELVHDLFSAYGLRSYIVLVNENYEAAYMNWENREQFQAALAAHGEMVGADAARFMQQLQWSEAVPYTGGEVLPASFYQSLYGTTRSKE